MSAISVPRDWSFGATAYDRGCQFDAMDEGARVERFEEETGLTFDPNGPGVRMCEYCDGLLQFMNHHECCGTQGANAEALYGGHGIIEE